MFKYKHCRKVLFCTKSAQLCPVEFKNNKLHHSFHGRSVFADTKSWKKKKVRLCNYEPNLPWLCTFWLCKCVFCLELNFCLWHGLFERLFGKQSNFRGCVLVFNQLPQSREMFVHVLKMPGLSFLWEAGYKQWAMHTFISVSLLSWAWVFLCSSLHYWLCCF